MINYYGGIPRPYGFIETEKGFAIDIEKIKNEITPKTKIFIYNNINQDSYSFIFLFGPNLKISISKKVYLKSFHKFFSYSKLNKYMEKKYYIKSLDLIYNIKSYKFQILCQIRPPLISLIVLSYYILFYGKLFG